MTYGYARVSTRGQAKDGNSLTAQVEALRNAGAEEIYEDAFTGTKNDRPALNDLLSKIKPGDALIVCKLDRLARSATAGYELIEGLLSKGITVEVLNMGKMDDSPTGRLIRQIFLSFAQFERDQIVSRCQEGRQVAKQRPDFREGRPPVYCKTQKAHALELLATHSYSQVEKMTGISKSTMIRYKREMGLLKK